MGADDKAGAFFSESLVISDTVELSALDPPNTGAVEVSFLSNNCLVLEENFSESFVEFPNNPLSEASGGTTLPSDTEDAAVSFGSLLAAADTVPNMPNEGAAKAVPPPRAAIQHRTKGWLCHP